MKTDIEQVQGVLDLAQQAFCPSAVLSRFRFIEAWSKLSFYPVCWLESFCCLGAGYFTGIWLRRIEG